MRAAIIPVTPLQQNCSLIWCTRTMKGALVDPGGDLDKLKEGVAKAKLAIKCDMCSGIDGGPACVRACPTGAALRVSPAEFVEFVSTGVAER